MRYSCRVPKGKGFLKGISIETLIKALREQKCGKPRDILLAALCRKKGWTLKEISECIQHSTSTIHDWLCRLEDGGLDAIYDKKSPGRSSKLSPQQQETLKADIIGSPTESGFERNTWTSPLVVLHIRKKFNVEYTSGGALSLAHRLSFSSRQARPIPHKTLSDEEIA